MRIGIDVRYLSHGLTGGVHTYISQLVPALLAQAAGHEVLLYADTKRPFELDRLPPYARVRLLPYRGIWSSVANDLGGLSRAAAQDRVDVLHFPANYGFAPLGVPSIVTLHDAINLLPLREIVRGHRKDPRTVATMTYLHLCSRASLRRAALVLTVSEHARREIAHVGGSQARVVAVPHAPAPDMRRIVDETALSAVRARYGLRRPFVLADGLKNPGVLVRAWALLPPGLREGHELLFFARREPPTVARQAEAEGFARILINPPHTDLIALYSLASAFAFPSWIEGFGIPLLEAMVCGAPIVASDRGAIPEVVGNAALLADAEDEHAFARHLALVLGDGPTATALRERGFARANQFSWANAAQQTLASYEQARARPAPASLLRGAE